MVFLCRVEKQVNGLQNHTDSEIDKTVSDDDDDDDAGKTAAQHRKNTAANKDDDDDDDDSDDSDDSEDDDVIAMSKPRPAKVIAGEVIKQWQTKTRSRGCMSLSSFGFKMLP